MIFTTFLTFFLSMSFADTEVEEYEIDEELIKYEQRQIKKKSKFTNHFKLTCGFDVNIKEDVEPEVFVNEGGDNIFSNAHFKHFSLKLAHIDTRELVKLAHENKFSVEKKIGRTDFIIKISTELYHHESFSNLSVHFKVREKNVKKEDGQFIDLSIDISSGKPSRVSIGSTKEFISLDNSKIKFSQFCY